MRPSRPAPAVRGAFARRTWLRLERLETRVTPCTTLPQPLGAAASIEAVAAEFQPVLVAGSPTGTPADSPAERVDPNTTTSPFAGVGSVQVNTRRATYIGTGTPISDRHILTAGHVVDINSDGRVTSRDGIQSAYFVLNFGGNQTHTLRVDSIDTNPEFTGFARPSVNDDLAILTLADPLPAGVPIYKLPSQDLAAGTTLTLVGYGRSGTGTAGYTTSASFTVKRSGENNADAFYREDDAGQPITNEVFRFDFDGPTGTGSFGGGTLGNDRETTLGGGDSGGPSFVDRGAGLEVVGVNTFTQGVTTPRFGSLGGGINVYSYLGFINSVLGRTASGAATAARSAAGGLDSAAQAGRTLVRGAIGPAEEDAPAAIDPVMFAALFNDAAPSPNMAPATPIAQAITASPAPVATPLFVTTLGAAPTPLPAGVPAGFSRPGVLAFDTFTQGGSDSSPAAAYIPTAAGADGSTAIPHEARRLAAANTEQGGPGPMRLPVGYLTPANAGEQQWLGEGADRNAVPLQAGTTRADLTVFGVAALLGLYYRPAAAALRRRRLSALTS